MKKWLAGMRRPILHSELPNKRCGAEASACSFADYVSFFWLFIRRFCSERINAAARRIQRGLFTSCVFTSPESNEDPRAFRVAASLTPVTLSPQP